MPMKHAEQTVRGTLRRRGAWVAMLALAGLLAGCANGGIRSRVQITSEPSGAEVIWRGQSRGATPIMIPFTWYWHYDVAVVKPGYKRIEVDEHFRTPPWFLMPLDLFAEMIPIPIHDTRYRHYVLEPQQTAEETPPVREINPLKAPAGN
jgi:hypothetical protein